MSFKSMIHAAIAFKRQPGIARLSPIPHSHDMRNAARPTTEHPFISLDKKEEIKIQRSFEFHCPPRRQRRALCSDAVCFGACRTSVTLRHVPISNTHNSSKLHAHYSYHKEELETSTSEKNETHHDVRMPMLLTYLVPLCLLFFL